MTITAYVGFGANLGERAVTCRRALSLLSAHPEVAPGRGSSFYESEPQGPVLQQPDFLNAVAELQTLLPASDLLTLLLEVEGRLGRRRTVPGGPRSLDLDLLLYGDLVQRSATLSVPHPRLSERRFVLVPLLEIAPELRHPVSGDPFAQLLAHAPPSRIAPWPGRGLEPSP